MAHKSLIVCDRCGANQTVSGSPYPLGWGLVTTTMYSKSEGHALVTDKKDRDLCPPCFDKLKVHI